MNIKSLLLGSAAALVAVSGARAADAVVAPEPEPVEYVRVCDVYGAGFYYIPGTETCLKVSGYFRYDIGAGSGVRDYDTGTGRVMGAWGLPNVQDKRSPFNDDGTANYNDAWNKKSRFQLRVELTVGDRTRHPARLPCLQHGIWNGHRRSHGDKSRHRDDVYN